MDVSVQLHKYEPIFGIINDEQDMIINQINFIQLMARYFIYRCKQDNIDLDLYKSLIGCRNALDTELEIRMMANETEVFRKYWDELYNNLS